MDAISILRRRKMTRLEKKIIPTEESPAPPEKERECEEFFNRTTTRDENGRFVIRLPFREDPKRLGESREIAFKRLTQLERRFKRSNILHKRYVEFMREYLELGHMSLARDNTRNTEHSIVYLPHHGVIKESSTTTKLRTVFDASSKTDSGVSLNDVLHVGPTLQSSLIEVVLRFRFHNVALTGDLRKMYRQIIVHPDDRDYQRILWRFSPDERVQEFQLNTVTYGEASSAYLAIKCIRQLAEQAKHEYPIASRVILDEVYVDDIMTGAKDVQQAITLQQQLEELLRSGGFEIHKWCSNEPESLEHVPAERREEPSKISIDANDTIKTLGLEWNPNEDQFQFSVRRIEPATTKRQILSAISKFFDPLGLIGPILTTAKLLMQETWRIECNWDEQLPETFVDNWEQFRRDLNSVETLSIPRRVITCKNPQRLYLQGFCDASERAYGACLYIQAQDEMGRLTSRLLCSKSRVSPIKPTSIPRLELCSAVLLARLIASVRNSLPTEVQGIQAWSDSKVALYWIRGDGSRWKTFVSNRVSEIIEIVPAENWDHVKGSENPADLISRGTSPAQLKGSELWWVGPSWLRETTPTSMIDSSASEPSRETLEKGELEERKKPQVCNVASCGAQVIQALIDRFSSLTKIERVLAYCRRYISNLKRPPIERSFDRLSTTELREAHHCLMKHIQGKHFGDDIADLKNRLELKSSSNLVQLLDEQGMLRVGGRLQHAPLKFERKHPIILPAGNRFSQLLFEREHRRLLHASQMLLLSSIKEFYWPLKGRTLARKVCHGCVWCAKNNPQELSQVMGMLPSDRVSPSKPFTSTGVDFAGPITTLVNKGRGRKTNKSYIALFVCFPTKALHLKATSELTTAAFLATLRRFIGRRGLPRTLYSDNATNFVGANRELQQIHKFVQTQVAENLGDELASQGID